MIVRLVPPARSSSNEGLSVFSEENFVGRCGNEKAASQAVALCEIIATAIVTRFSDYSETQPIAVKLGRA